MISALELLSVYEFKGLGGWKIQEHFSEEGSFLHVPFPWLESNIPTILILKECSKNKYKSCIKFLKPT